MFTCAQESCTSEEEVKIKKRQQKQRISETFRRQLSIPLMEMENTYQELGSWLNEEENSSELIDMASLEASYKKALEKLSRILSFEESLVIKFRFFSKQSLFALINYYILIPVMLRARGKSTHLSKISELREKSLRRWQRSISCSMSLRESTDR